MGTPHKWADVLRAIADGKAVQVKLGSEWVTDESGRYSPITQSYLQWRIKPEHKPDNTIKLLMKESVFRVVQPGMEDEYPPNLILVFDGETGKLKSAEVLE